MNEQISQTNQTSQSQRIITTGNPSSLPEKPDTAKFWTWQSCDKSTQKVQHYNIDGKCKLFVHD